MDWDNLRYFLELARAGTLVGAARRLGVDHTTVARRIAARFSLDEVNGLAFELGLDGSLTGDSLENRSASLVKVAMQRDALTRLVALCRRERPRGGF